MFEMTNSIQKDEKNGNYFFVFIQNLQKQYIFLYRALLDVAQFGNTEIPFKDLPTTMEQLKQRSNDSRDQCKLEIEFEVGYLFMHPRIFLETKGLN